MTLPLTLRFPVTPGILFGYDNHAALAEYRDGTLSVSLSFRGHDTPLTLAAPARAGDRAELTLFPWRMELWVNDVLQDEEWPHGEPLLLSARCIRGEEPLVTAPLPRPTPPAVLGEFTHAEGWKPEGEVYVGDCMPYCADGRYHVLYLKDRHRHHSKWHKGAHQWEHLSTDDLRTFRIHPMAVPIDDPEEGSICTGSHIQKGGTHYLFYTVRTMDGSPAPIRRSVSADGYHFEKDAAFSFTLSERFTGASARDPKLVLDADGLYHMFVTSTECSGGRGCLVHLTSPDLENWSEEAEPIYRAPDSAEPECPDYLALNGYYYLIFSLHGKGHYLYSTEPFRGFVAPADPIIPCKSVPKAAVFRGRILFAGFDGGGKYAGTLTFKEAFQTPSGLLTFGEVAETREH
ncbi:MAG: hypothetical protein IKZ21_07200 [Clostridia bacterium]|nr:hypothetical protein [Clostridia bacterium]